MMNPSPLLRRILAGLSLSVLILSGTAKANCDGVNLFNELPPTARSEIAARTTATPYATGNFWRATRGDEALTIIGTYHFDDPRHRPVIEAANGLIADAGALLVEAGPKEESALKSAMAKDPSLMFITDGPTLLEQLPAETWERLAAALAERGIPGFFAAKFQPWYATVVLAIPPCAMAQMAEPRGLDGSLIDLATGLNVPVVALEPYDTLFSIFGGLTQQQSVDMIESSLAMEARSADFAATLGDMYFAGESRMIWELTRVWSYDIPGYSRDEIDAEMAVMEEAMMLRRNRAWIPVIEAVVEAKGAPLVVAFGALHLSGEAGVLNLLTQNGWSLERIEF